MPATAWRRARFRPSAWPTTFISSASARRRGIFGVVSTNAMHSLSPVMHNAAFEAAGIDAVYVPLRAARLRRLPVLRGGDGHRGRERHDSVQARRAAARRRPADPLTQSVGAANTLRRDGRRLGSDQHRRRRLSRAARRRCLARGCRGARAAVLGAGGSARAVVVALRSRGALVDRLCAAARSRRRQLAQSLGASAGEWPPAPGSWDLLVNCTPLGGAGERDESPLPRDAVTGPLVYDLTYGAGRRRCCATREAAGCADARRTADADCAGRAAVRVVDGQQPEPGVMAAAVRRRWGDDAQITARGREARIDSGS